MCKRDYEGGLPSVLPIPRLYEKVWRDKGLSAISPAHRNDGCPKDKFIKVTKVAPLHGAEVTLMGFFARVERRDFLIPCPFTSSPSGGVVGKSNLTLFVAPKVSKRWNF